MPSETEQYSRVCKGEFEKLNRKLDGIHNRLYVDNGTESIQSKLNRFERWIRGMAWFAGIATAASVSTLVTMAIKALVI